MRVRREDMKKKMKKNDENIESDMEDNDLTQIKSNDNFLVDNGHEEQNHIFPKGKNLEKIDIEEKDGSRSRSKFKIDSKPRAKQTQERYENLSIVV